MTPRAWSAAGEGEEGGGAGLLRCPGCHARVDGSEAGILSLELFSPRLTFISASFSD